MLLLTGVNRIWKIQRKIQEIYIDLVKRLCIAAQCSDAWFDFTPYKIFKQKKSMELLTVVLYFLFVAWMVPNEPIKNIYNCLNL